MKHFIRIAILLVVIMLGAGAGNALPSEPVAYDIVFTYGEVYSRDLNFRPNRLAVYSAATSESIPFYIDEDASGVRPLVWSSSGQYLAILKSFRSEDSHTTQEQICLLRRHGELVTCFEERPPTNYDSTSFQENYDITWSENEEMIYFIAERDSMRRLVEVEITTGETKRVLFETEAIRPNDLDGIWPVTYAWSPNLEYVISGVGRFQPLIQLTNLKTGEISDLSTIVLPYGAETTNESSRIGYICNSFSTIHNYMTAIEYSDSQISDRIIVFSPQLEVILTIDSYPTQEQVDVDACPIWNSDESMIYFFIREHNTGERFLAGYSLEQGDYEVAQLVSPNVYSSSIRVSPDENHIAFIFNSAYGWWAMMMPVDSDERTRLAPQWEFSAYPLWIPASSGGQ